MVNGIKIVAVAALCLLVGGCGWLDRRVAVWTGYSTACIDGVQYIEFSSGTSVAYDRDGKVKACKS